MEKILRKPYKYPIETFELAHQLKKEGKNNTQIAKILGIPFETQVRRILKYPYKEAFKAEIKQD